MEFIFLKFVLCLSIMSFMLTSAVQVSLRGGRPSYRSKSNPKEKIGDSEVAKQNDRISGYNALKSNSDHGLQVPFFLGFDSDAFAMTIKVGSSNQTLNVTIALDVELLWLQCPPCENCNFAVFQPANSKSYANLACDSPLCSNSVEVQVSCQSSCFYNVTYGSDNIDFNSFTGNYATETLSWASSKVDDIGFGCGQEYYGSDSGGSTLDYFGTSGIVGFNKEGKSFISQLASSMYQSKFAYCASYTNDNGTLAIGSYKLNSSVAYTPMLSPNSSSDYLVGLKSIGFGDEQIPAGETVISSTTLFTYLVPSSFDRVMEVVDRSLQNISSARVVDNFFTDSTGIDYCYNVSDFVSDFPLLPTMSFDFGNNTTIELPDEQLWIYVNNDEYCFTIGSSEVLDIDYNMIGTYHQLDMVVDFDLINMKIGFGPKEGCDNKISLTPSGATKKTALPCMLLSLLYIVIFY